MMIFHHIQMSGLREDDQIPKDFSLDSLSWFRRKRIIQGLLTLPLMTFTILI
uniref:Uncharacterized protein n=1 Tax=Meloidogyne enterolobii TaxID=390850 RepID=A0A6V7VP37_MELEN|nr:unnamed protein product [Meloidogyne enterolobii]